jgi:alkylated DNA repair dioxygenase AlkB
MSSLQVSSLFPDMPAARQVLPALPQGFRYKPGFISEDEERELLARIDELQLHQAVWNGYAALRRVASFSLSDTAPEQYRSDPNKGSATLADDAVQRDDGTVPSKPVPTRQAPSWLRELSARIGEHLGHTPGSICHALITEYPAGAPIGWHVDSPPHSAIIGLSLGSDCTFRLRPARQEFRSRESLISFTAQQRSLYEMAGASRERWQHSIRPVPARRVSITLRTM